MKKFKFKALFSRLNPVSRRILLLGVGTVSAVSLPFVLLACFGELPFLRAQEMKSALPSLFENWLLCLCVSVGGALLADAVEKDGT